jgi:hypothetical protein
MVVRWRPLTPLLLTACAGASAPVRRPPVVPDDAASSACPTDGTFGLRLHGAGLEAHEGRRLSVSVVEPVQSDSGTPRTFRVDTRVSAGSFEVSCPTALRENMAYPAWAVLVDVDADGRCGGSDIGLVGQFYGWTEDHEGEVTADQWMPVAGGTPLHGPMLEGSPAFCAGFFP